MKRTSIIGGLSALLLIAGLVPLKLNGTLYANMDTELQIQLVKQARALRLPAKWDAVSIFKTAPLTVALVYGRSQGCADAAPELINDTARAAIDAGLDPAIEAATVATESACNPFAVSSKGAVGCQQIMAKIWSAKYDFAGAVNLFNCQENMHVGAQIEAGLIAQYGTIEGVRRYNGAGIGCDTCDSGYTSKILNLAGRR